MTLREVFTVDESQGSDKYHPRQPVAPRLHPLLFATFPISSGRGGSFTELLTTVFFLISAFLSSTSLANSARLRTATEPTRHLLAAPGPPLAMIPTFDSLKIYPHSKLLPLTHAVIQPTVHARTIYTTVHVSRSNKLVNKATQFCILSIHEGGRCPTPGSRRHGWNLEHRQNTTIKVIGVACTQWQGRIPYWLLRW